MRILSVIFSVGSLCAQAAGPFHWPYLERLIGKEANLGTATTCQLFDTLPKVKWDDVKKDIDQAVHDAKDMNNFEVRQYNRAQVPSETYVAKIVTHHNGGKVESKDLVILENYGSYKGLKTEAGKNLIALLDKHCGPKAIAVVVTPKKD